jgi:hypothetical protein
VRRVQERCRVRGDISRVEAVVTEEKHRSTSACNERRVYGVKPV